MCQLCKHHNGWNVCTAHAEDDSSNLNAELSACAQTVLRKREIVCLSLPSQTGCPTNCSLFDGRHKMTPCILVTTSCNTCHLRVLLAVSDLLIADHWSRC